ncbi:uncharacterized protein NPIL_20801 [Nephila pilipes]|uniref:C2H2-type domain-containing protein n=1 Tax=Nephila pilipes TaxID=299642 RepID=A0A8X6QP25_NEPPI|nr:uncharacterized protein NPIL_20801 [Nephila pilipes]
MSCMFECVNHSSVAESDFVMCGDNSNPDSVMNDVVPCSNDFSVAESNFFMYGDNSNPNSVTSDMVRSTNDKSVGESDFVCPDCFQSFKNKYNLKRHIYKFHNDNTTLIESFKSQCANDGNVAESIFVCPDCLKTFKNRYNLKHHVNKVHSNNTELIESLKNRSFSYQCEDCHLKFSDLKNFKCHQNKVHTSKINQNANYVCLVCHGNFKKREIIFHFKNAHDIDMDHTELELNSFNDFLAWKAEIENNTKSKFISYSTKHINIHGAKYYYFRCHRSGNFMLESKDERKNIASKIAAKIPLDNILDEIRNSISDAGIERVHLLTKKDLHNIEKSFNLTSNSVKHENDGVSVDMWVRKMQNSENPCILLYKTQGSTCMQYSFLKENDFVLIIMTEAQGEILKKFSSDCICIDGTHGVNGYGFELVTLLTIDDLRQGFPCAFLISNQCDQPVLSIFFCVY